MILDYYHRIRRFWRGDMLRRIHDRSQGTKPVSHEVWTQLLRRHVRQGKVDYPGFQQDRSLLQQYLHLLSANAPNPRHWSIPEQLAYWINAYNAFTVELVLRYYPLDSINLPGPQLQGSQVNTVWDLKFFTIAGLKMTLNTIEHQILRQHYEEPRIHFAINCASFSCPRLREEAFTGDELEEQLQDQARDFVNDPVKNRVQVAQAELSQIFEWFADDFMKKRSLPEYINQFARTPMRTDAPITYIPYNWGLNE